MAHEEIDDHPIEYYKLKFLAGQGTILDKDWAIQHCRIGDLPIFIVAGRVKWRPEVDREGSLYKLVQVTPEPDLVVPVPREMRDQALRFLANNGNAALDIPDEEVDAESVFLGEIAIRDIDRLKAFLGAHFAEDVLSSDDQDPVGVAIDLLKQLERTSDEISDADDSVEEEEICGVSYDHDLALVDERDGWRSYECRRCGAEIEEQIEDFEDPGEDAEEAIAPAPLAAVPDVRPDPNGPIFDEPPEGYEGRTFSRAMVG